MTHVLSRWISKSIQFEIIELGGFLADFLKMCYYIVMSKEEIKEKIIEAVEKEPNKNNIKFIRLFGSHAYGKPRRKSDVDLLIDFYQPIGFFELAGIQEGFQKTTGLQVDLVTPGALSPYFKDKVLKKAETIYGKVWRRSLS